MYISKMIYRNFKKPKPTIYILIYYNEMGGAGFIFI